MNFVNLLRKNIGTIIAILGFALLCIVTFGDLGEILAEEYWLNVRNNLTSIGFMTIGLTLIQVSIKQGLAEQALQRGLNTERTTEKYEEHKTIIKANNDKLIYLPYFLQIYNKRHTKLKKQEFLINNNFTAESLLYASGKKDLIRKYERIRVNVTAGSIKWSTVDIVYNKEGRIITLNEYRARRITSSIITSLAGMIGVTFLAGGLFFSPTTEPLWQKFVRLLTYTITIVISAIFTTVKEYEKGAFGVPNELDEINQIWHEFQTWEVPEWICEEVARLNQEQEAEVNYEQSTENERTVDRGATLQEEQTQNTDIQHIDSCELVFVTNSDTDIQSVDDTEQCGQCDGDTEPVG